MLLREDTIPGALPALGVFGLSRLGVLEGTHGPCPVQNMVWSTSNA